MEKTLDKILVELQSLNNRVGGLETEVKSGFEGVKNEFEGVKNEFEGVNNRFEDINTQFEGMNTQFEGINKKLDTIYAQVAHNTEQEVRLSEVISKVEEHDTDIKLIKKVVVNQ